MLHNVTTVVAFRGVLPHGVITLFLALPTLAGINCFEPLNSEPVQPVQYSGGLGTGAMASRREAPKRGVR